MTVVGGMPIFRFIYGTENTVNILMKYISTVGM